MKKLQSQLLFVGILLVLFSACDKNRVFEKYEKIPQTGWHKDSLVVFSIPVTDTISNHNLSLNIRNDIAYQYSNLWLFVGIHQPDGLAVTDTFEVLLADQTGRWLGDGFGGIKTRRVAYRSGVYFPDSGEYKITVQHGMRDVILQSMTDIGIRVEKAE